MIWKKVLGILALALATPMAHAINCTAGGAFFDDMERVGGLATDLTTAGATGTAGTGVLVEQVSPQPTGTGNIDPFLRIQRANSPCVAGFNTGGDAGGTLDDLAGTWTHALATSSLTTTNINGTNYVQFLLDINQTGSDPLLSLESFRLFSFGDGGLEGVDGLNALLGGAAGVTSLFNMDAGGDRRLLLNYGLNTGSGSGDVLFSIDANYFLNAGNFIYLFSRFGALGTVFENNDGFEEWALVTNDCPLEGCTSVPEPGSMGLLGAGLLGLGVFARRKRFNG